MHQPAPPDDQGWCRPLKRAFSTSVERGFSGVGRDPVQFFTTATYLDEGPAILDSKVRARLFRGRNPNDAKNWYTRLTEAHVHCELAVALDELLGAGGREISVDGGTQVSKRSVTKYRKPSKEGCGLNDSKQASPHPWQSIGTALLPDAIGTELDKSVASALVVDIEGAQHPGRDFSRVTLHILHAK